MEAQRLSRLETGQRVSLDDLGAAADRLARRVPLKPNDVFNPSKIVPFVVDERRRMPNAEITSATQLDEAAGVAHVRVVIRQR